MREFSHPFAVFAGQGRRELHGEAAGGREHRHGHRLQGWIAGAALEHAISYIGLMMTGRQH